MSLSNFNQNDSKVTIKPTLFHWNGQENQVCISGSFQLHGVNDWTPITMIKADGQNQFTIALNLKPGEYQYKYVVDGQWTCDFQSNTTTDDSGNVNNVISVLDTTVKSEKDSSDSKTSPEMTINEFDSFSQVSSPTSVNSELKPNQLETEFILEDRTSESPVEQPSTLSEKNIVNLEDNPDNCKSAFNPTTLDPEIMDSNMPSLTNSSSAKPSHHNSLDSRTLDSELHELTSQPINDNLLQLELEENDIEHTLPKNVNSGFPDNSLENNDYLTGVNSESEKGCDVNFTTVDMESSLNNQDILEANQDCLKDDVFLEDTITTNNTLILTEDNLILNKLSSSDIYGQETRLALDEVCQLYNKEETPLQENTVLPQDNEKHDQGSVPICDINLNKDEKVMPSTDTTDSGFHQENKALSYDEAKINWQPSPDELLALSSATSDIHNVDNQKPNEEAGESKDELNMPLLDSDRNKYEPDGSLLDKTEVKSILNDESPIEFNSESNEIQYTVTFPLRSKSILDVSKKECLVLSRSFKNPDDSITNTNASSLETTDLENLDQGKSTPLLSESLKESNTFDSIPNKDSKSLDISLENHTAITEALSYPEEEISETFKLVNSDSDSLITREVESVLLVSTNLDLLEDSKEKENKEDNYNQDDIITDYNKHHNSDFLTEPPQMSLESLDVIGISKEAENLLAVSTEETVLGSDEPKTKPIIHLEVLKDTSSCNTVTLDDEFTHQKGTFASDKEIVASLEDQAFLNEMDKKLDSSETKEPEIILLNTKSSDVNDQTKLDQSRSDENSSVAKSLSNSPNLDLTKDNSDNSKPYNAVFVASKYLFFGIVALLIKFYRTFTWGMFFKTKNDDPKPDTKDGYSKDNVVSSLKNPL